MRALRRHPRLVLVAVGVLSVLVGYTAGGELFHGYGKSGGAYLVHAGVFALLLAGTETVLDRISLPADRKGVATALLAIAALYPMAVGFIWYDLVVTPPPNYGADPSLTGLAMDRLGFVLALTPLAVGHVLGAYVSTSSTDRSPAIPVLAAVLVVTGPSLAYLIAVRGGAHPGFTGLFYGVVTLAGIVGSIPFYIIARWAYADRADTNSQDSPSNSAV